MDSKPLPITSGNNPTASATENVAVIEPNAKWRLLDFRELIDYRDLFFFLVWLFLWFI